MAVSSMLKSYGDGRDRYPVEALTELCNSIDELRLLWGTYEPRSAYPFIVEDRAQRSKTYKDYLSCLDGPDGFSVPTRQLYFDRLYYCIVYFLELPLREIPLYVGDPINLIVKTIVSWRLRVGAW